jgi:hypothetical protein
MNYAKRILLIGMFASIILLLSVPTAMAFSDEPCTGVNYECTTCTNCVAPPSSPPTAGDPYTYTDSSGWTISLYIQSRNDGLFDWYYGASNGGSVSGLKKINWGIANCCTTPVTYVSPGANDGGLSSPGNLKVFSAGIGAPSGWGEAIKNIIVIQASPDNTGIFRLTSNTDKMTMGPVALELAGGDVPLSYPVPACASAAPPAFAGDKTSYSAECREVINDCLDVDKDPQTACTNVKLSVFIPKNNLGVIIDDVRWYPNTTDCGDTGCDDLTGQEKTDCENGLAPAAGSTIVYVDDAPYYCSGLGDERQSECIRVEIGSLYSCTQSGAYASCINLCPYYAQYGYVPPGCP